MDQRNHFNISQESIDLMKLNYSQAELDSMKNNQSKLLSSIMLLKEIGVTDKTIEEILICEYSVLMPGREYLIRALAKIGDVRKFVSLLNEDINYVDYLSDIK